MPPRRREDTPFDKLRASPHGEPAEPRAFGPSWLRVAESNDRRIAHALNARGQHEADELARRRDVVGHRSPYLRVVQPLFDPLRHAIRLWLVELIRPDTLGPGGVPPPVDLHEHPQRRFLRRRLVRHVGPLDFPRVPEMQRARSQSELGDLRGDRPRPYVGAAVKLDVGEIEGITHTAIP